MSRRSRRRTRDLVRDCPVRLLPDGSRALQLWPDWTPPPIALPNVVLVRGRHYYVLTIENLALLVIDAIDDPAASEQRLSVLRRMMSQQEWAEAVEMADAIRRGKTPSD